MKNYLKLILCLVLSFCFSGCEKQKETMTESMETNEEVSSPLETVEAEDEIGSDSTVLVAYFSRTGNTKVLVDYAAEFYGADIFEINAKNPYTDEDINYNDPNSRNSIEQNDKSVRPKIDGKVDNMNQYDTIILAYPIWWGQAPRIIDTFLESYDFSGKTIVPFCTSASSDIGSSDDNLHLLVADDVNWIQGKRFPPGADKTALIEWLEQVCP